MDCPNKHVYTIMFIMLTILVAFANSRKSHNKAVIDSSTIVTRYGMC